MVVDELAYTISSMQEDIEQLKIDLANEINKNSIDT